MLGTPAEGNGAEYIPAKEAPKEAPLEKLWWTGRKWFCFPRAQGWVSEETEEMVLRSIAESYFAPQQKDSESHMVITI